MGDSEESEDGSARMTDDEVDDSSSDGKNDRLYAHDNHYLAKYVFRGGAILQAVRGRFRSPFSYEIVFGKETSIELVTIREDGTLQSLCEQSVFGVINDLAVLRSSERLPAAVNKGTDLLVVASGSPFLAILSFCQEMHRFIPLKHVTLCQQEDSRTNLGRMLAVDSRGYFLSVGAYEDRISVLSVSPSAGNNIVDRIIYYPSDDQRKRRYQKFSFERDAFGTIWSMCFISKDYNLKDGYDCVLAVIMHRKHASYNELVLFGCNIEENSMQVISKFFEAGTLLLNVTEVPRLHGFAILFGMGCILLMDLRDPTSPHLIQKISLTREDHIDERGLDVDDDGVFEAAACALLELRDASAGKYTRDDPMITDIGNNGPKVSSRFVSSWGWELSDSIFPKLVFCDDTGELFKLDLCLEFNLARMNLSDCLFSISPCKVLLWVKRETIVAIVEMGDGMILKMENVRPERIHTIQNISPLLNLCFADHHEEKRDQMFACCGMAPEGSVRTVRSGIGVERLLKTAPIYEGINGIWTLQINESDPYHSFLVISFVEETRVLTVGLNFVDVTEAVGFRADVCTLACGLLSDGILVQIHKTGVRISSPKASEERESNKVAVSASWYSHDMTINLGAVGHNLIVVATSNPSFIFLLGIRAVSTNEYQIYEIKSIKLVNEISCISIPKQKFNHGSANCESAVPPGFEFDRTFIVGTHKPSVEIVSVLPNGDCRILAVGNISIANKFASPASGCIPENVKIVMVDQFYVLAGLRNGMLLRYEWPTVLKTTPTHGLYHHHGSSPMNAKSMDASFPVSLQLASFRHIGITPIFLVPLNDSLDSDIITLSDRPWLLHVARHSLTYEPIQFHSASHVTPVCSCDCPQGILFASESSLNLVEVVPSKRVNAEKFCLDGSCRKILYHRESKTLLVIRRGLFDDSCLSDICRVDPRDGSILARFKFEGKEIAKSIQIVKVGNEQVLVVGTCRTMGRIIAPNGESESSNGRLIVISLRTSGSAARDGVQLENMEEEQLQVVATLSMPGSVFSICSYLDRFVIASAGSFLCVCGFVNDNPHRLRRLATTKSRFTVTCLTAHLDRIAAGDCRDGVLFYKYEEEHKKLELVYSDPFQRLVAECFLVDQDTVVVSDRMGMISMLSSPKPLEENANPEQNLKVGCSYHLGETVMTIQKGSLQYSPKKYNSWENDLHSPRDSIVCGTMLGNLVALIPLTSEEHKILEAVQAALSIHPLTAPILGNGHALFRRGSSNPANPVMLDGDMLAQFLELTLAQQVQVLGACGDVEATVDDVIWLLERINHAVS